MLRHPRRSRGGLCALGILGLALGPAAVSADGAPVIERVEPSVGPPGTLLRITGRRLRGETRVQIGETPLAIELCTPNLVSARLAPGSRSGRLRLVTLAGQVEGPEFVVSAAPRAPVIERFQPLRAAGGALLTIAGQGFSTRLAQNTVLFGAAQAIVSAATPTQLRVVVPATASAGPISVRVLGAGEARSAQLFEPLQGLVVSEVLPARATRNTRLELRGSGFERGVRVLLGETPLRVLEVAPTRLLVVLGPNAQSGRLRVEGKLAAVSYAPEPFEVIAPPALSGVAPLAGPPGTRIALSGSGFGRDAAALSVQLGELPLAVREISPTQLLVELPPAAQSGKITLTLGAFPRLQSAREFIVTEALALENLRPTGGPPGSELIIEGRGFLPIASDDVVRFAGVAAEVLEASPTRLRVRVPAAKSGPIQLSVGVQQLESRTAFIVTAPPRVSAISAEPLLVSREFTVSGSGFGQNPALVRVTLAERRLEVLAVRDDAIVVRAPAAPESGPLTVFVALQGSASYARPIRVVEAH